MNGKLMAPSEKHLEDYLVAHPEALSYDEGETPVYSFALRQYRVPSGIIDLIGFDYRLCVFELKRDVLTAQSLTQLMRYMADVKAIMCDLLQRLQGQQDTRPFSNSYWDNESNFNLSRLVGGVLIGRDVENENFLTACAGCGIDVWVYDYDDGQYRFWDHSPYMTIEVQDQFEAYDFSDLESHVMNFYAKSIRRKYQESLPSLTAIELAEHYLDSLGGGS